jgi:hypothetical protein
MHYSALLLALVVKGYKFIGRKAFTQAQTRLSVRPLEPLPRPELRQAG